MPIDVQRRLAVTAIALLAILSGCAMQPSAPGPEAGGETARARGEGAPAAAAERAPDAEVAAAEADAADADAAGADASRDDPIAAVLAERRRGDYPEIEVQPTGFTITEQVRIGGSARSDYEMALVLLAQERYAEGIAILERVTAAVPDATVPYIDLGIAYRRSGQLEKSEEALDTAALLSPDHPIVHNELGIIYRETGRFDEARASYERALAVFADFHFARRNLAVLCDLYLADLQCALEHYRAFLEAAGSDAEVEIWIADVANRLGDQEG